MKSFSLYVEQRKVAIGTKAEEEREERSGLDLDHDNERKESSGHAKKVLKKHREMIEFFTKRREGAKKIAKSARAKGGPSMLTYWHFEIKNAVYTEVIEAIKNNQDEPYFRTKWKKVMRMLHSGTQKQEDFQKTIGELEVWGEAISQLFN